MPHRFACLCLLLATSSASAALEIWLARSPACNSCGIFEQAAQARGYDGALDYAVDGAPLRIPIREVDKDRLTAATLAQLPRELLQDSNWPLMLTVLVVDDGRVLSQGNIAESADNTRMRYSAAEMFPPDAPSPDHAVFSAPNIYTRFFAANWNLEYFVDVALGRRSARTPRPLIDLGSARPLALGRANVVLWGSAPKPLDNALFIPTRITEIRAVLAGMPGLDAVRYWTLFGHGPAVPGNDTSYLVDRRTRFMRADLAVDLPADAPSLNALFTAVRDRGDGRTLLIQVGHSGPTGSPLWGSGLTLTPADLAGLSSSELVMVSGACHGGTFARVGQCGFFAAHPDVIAAGCQLSPDAVLRSDDYLRYFFQAAGDSAALEAAHWHAASRIEDHQISYQTTDALIDDYFAAHPERLPATMTVGEMQSASGMLTRAEASALSEMTAKLSPALAVTLTGHVALNQDAQAKLADATELSSAERNRIIALPYKLGLAQLARRIAYKSLGTTDADFTAASDCESRSIPDLLSNAP